MILIKLANSMHRWLTSSLIRWLHHWMTSKLTCGQYGTLNYWLRRLLAFRFVGSLLRILTSSSSNLSCFLPSRLAYRWEIAFEISCSRLIPFSAVFAVSWSITPRVRISSAACRCRRCTRVCVRSRRTSFCYIWSAWAVESRQICSFNLACPCCVVTSVGINIIWFTMIRAVRPSSTCKTRRWRSRRWCAARTVRLRSGTC